MSQPPGACSGYCRDLAPVLTEIQVELRAIRVEMRETFRQTQEHLRRIDEACPKHEERIRNCEDELLEIRTIAKVVPWTGKVLWGMVGISLSAVIYLLNKLIPYVLAVTQFASPK